MVVLSIHRISVSQSLSFPFLPHCTPPPMLCVLLPASISFPLYFPPLILKCTRDLFSSQGSLSDDKECSRCKVEEMLDVTTETSICIKWKATDRVHLAKLTSQPMTFAGTVLGRHWRPIKKQVNNVMTKIFSG